MVGKRHKTLTREEKGFLSHSKVILAKKKMLPFLGEGGGGFS